MKVRTKRRHNNAFGDTYVKHPQKQYEVPDAFAGPLIDRGLVEEVDDEDQDDGV